MQPKTTGKADRHREKRWRRAERAKLEKRAAADADCVVPIPPVMPRGMEDNIVLVVTDETSGREFRIPLKSLEIRRHPIPMTMGRGLMATTYAFRTEIEVHTQRSLGTLVGALVGDAVGRTATEGHPLLTARPPAPALTNTQLQALRQLLTSTFAEDLLSRLRNDRPTVW